MAATGYDVVIAGAGPAGAMCALSCARAGLKTLVVERGPAKTFGNPCIVEVEQEVFAHCGIPAPVGDERAYALKAARLQAPSGAIAFDMLTHGIYPLKLEKLVHRLVRYAQEAGAEFLFGHEVQGPVLDGERIIGLTIRAGRGAGKRLSAKVTVDATGHTAALVRRLPPALGMDFKEAPENNVVAEARLYTIDVAAAMKAADAGRFEPDVFYHHTGYQGTYSVRSLLVMPERGQGYTLVGVKENNMPPTAEEISDRFAADLGFFGEILHRGRGVIRVRRAGLRLVGDGFATVGEAGSMVIPAHASGIATGMFAGHALGVHLGALLRDGGDPTTAALWPWAAAYQRGRGAVLASYDANRRFFESLDPLRDVDPLFVNGVADPADVHATANASPIRLDPRSLPRRLAGAVRAPRAALGFLAGLPKIALVEHHWRRYPLAWDLDTFAAWRQTAMQLLP